MVQALKFEKSFWVKKEGVEFTIWTNSIPQLEYAHRCSRRSEMNAAAGTVEIPDPGYCSVGTHTCTCTPVPGTQSSCPTGDVKTALESPAGNGWSSYVAPLADVSSQ